MSRRAERGMSLTEVTIILTVLSALTAVLAPSIGTYVNDARDVAAQAETRAIGTAILSVLRDTGSRCLRLNATLDCTVTNRVDLLVTSGQAPSGIDTTLAPDVTLPDSEAATNGTVNWIPSASQPSQGDLLEDQLVENDNPSPYSAPSFTSGGGVRMKLGWRGPYLSSVIVADPWNAQYQVNTMFLAVANNATDTAMSPNQFQEGLREAAWLRDVVVLSAGRNGVVETPFGGTATTGTSPGGDDVIHVIRGASR